MRSSPFGTGEISLLLGVQKRKILLLTNFIFPHLIFRNSLCVVQIKTIEIIFVCRFYFFNNSTVRIRRKKNLEVNIIFIFDINASTL